MVDSFKRLIVLPRNLSTYCKSIRCSDIQRVRSSAIRDTIFGDVALGASIENSQLQ